MRVPSSGFTLARIPAVNMLSYFVVLDELATISGGNSLLDFANEPLIVVDQTLDGFDYQGFAVAALLGSQLRKFSLQGGTQMQFHGV